MAYKNLIFDMDDTILKCGLYYQNCKDEFIRYSHARTGIDEGIITQILNSIDIASTGFADGFSTHRLPRSFAAASSALDIITGHPVDEQAASKCYYIAESVFFAQYDPFPGAIETLREYKVAGYRMFLLTKGDHIVQWFKINKHGLGEFFDRSVVNIVDKKTHSNIDNIIAANRLEKDETVMIGDSVRDDISSAEGAGIDSVLIACDKPTWGYENTDHIPTYTIGNLDELRKIIPINPFPN